MASKWVMLLMVGILACSARQRPADSKQFPLLKFG
jgi:hypothetical protein